MSQRHNELVMIHLDSPEQVKQAYIPFFKNGGLFIPANDSYKMHDEVPLKLQLFSANETYFVLGTIVWLPANDFQDLLLKDVGIEFEETAYDLRKRMLLFSL